MAFVSLKRKAKPAEVWVGHGERHWKLETVEVNKTVVNTESLDKVLLLVGVVLFRPL